MIDTAEAGDCGRAHCGTGIVKGHRGQRQDGSLRVMRSQLGCDLSSDFLIGVFELSQHAA